MSGNGFITVNRLLTFASVAEFGTGLAFMADPALVIRLLLGVQIAGIAFALARFFGVGLVSLSLACWPEGAALARDASPFRGMLVYSALVALYLGYLGAIAHVAGPLLWPAAALHAVVALLLVWAWRSDSVGSAGRNGDCRT